MMNARSALSGLKHQKEKRSMAYFVGLDVSVKGTRVCMETRHMRAMWKAQINKTDRNDARGIAKMMRAGLYRPVHVKTLRSQKLRMLLTHRKLLQSKAIR